MGIFKDMKEKIMKKSLVEESKKSIKKEIENVVVKKETPIEPCEEPFIKYMNHLTITFTDESGFK